MRRYLPLSAIAHHRAGAVIDLAFFAGRGQDDPDGLRGVSAAQLAHEAVDRLIAAAEAVVVDQVLPDRHGVAAAVKPQLDDFSIRLAGAGRG